MYTNKILITIITTIQFHKLTPTYNHNYCCWYSGVGMIFSLDIVFLVGRCDAINLKRFSTARSLYILHTEFTALFHAKLQLGLD